MKIKMFVCIIMNTNVLVLISAILVVIIDSFYLQLTKNHFSMQVKRVQNSPLKIEMTSAILCYIFIIFGINYFIIRKRRSVTDAFLLGLVIYGIFELTNKAILKDWMWSSVVIDTLWGGTLFALVTYLTYLIDKLI